MIVPFINVVVSGWMNESMNELHLVFFWLEFNSTFELFKCITSKPIIIVWVILLPQDYTSSNGMNQME